MIVLGIESTCDETACALVRDGKEILSSVIRSQIEDHKPFHGVYPELACRKHIDALIPVIKQAFQEASLSFQDVGLIAAAEGPGLIGALLIGLNAGKALAYSWNLPFVGVNHVEAHLYAAMLSCPNWELPALGLVISGGHTLLVKIEQVGRYKLLATTRDDAVGEAFDKVATLLELPYPGGPHLEKIAKQGDRKRYSFKPGFVKSNPLDFSFSGLKTNVLYAIRGQDGQSGRDLSLEEKRDLAASFQEAALLDLVGKTEKASLQTGCKTVFCGGGVSNNLRLRELFLEHTDLTVYYPEPRLTTDNGAMIAALGYPLYRKEGPHLLNRTPKTRIPFD